MLSFWLDILINTISGVFILTLQYQTPITLEMINPKNNFWLNQLPFILCMSAIILILIPESLFSQQRRRCRAGQFDQKLNTNLPIGYNELFAGSGECLLCHNSMTDDEGIPHGVLDDWRSTMMANAAKDPLWRAKVSHETLVNPAHAEALENICTRCHAPLGNFNAHHIGQEFYGITEMETDTLGLDGVSCTLCHQIRSETYGNYSGNLMIGTEKTIWGPYIDPFTMPMYNHTGYTSAYGSQIMDARICGGCHTLITNSVDLDGNPTENSFVEQAIYHEWLNSVYPEKGQTCQSCHVPRLNDTMVISTMPPWLDGRSPFGMHHYAGANVFMQQILKDNIEELGITAEGVQFDSTVSRTLKLLQESTLELDLSEIDRTNDTLFLKLELKNISGHKFPGGFPSRRAFVEIIMNNENGDTLFHCGKMDSDYLLIFEDENFEPHHNIINSYDDVQIYEMVMGDINGNVTTVLERAYDQIKDNRIPPEGFTTLHYSYDTVKIAGEAKYDNNFNNSEGIEGSGSDIIYVNAFINHYTGKINTRVKIYYQTVSLKWMADMFTYSSDEIDSWKTIYEEADREPVLVVEANHLSISTGISSTGIEDVTLYPIPSKGKVFVNDEENLLTQCDVYNLSGKKLITTQFENGQKELNLDGENGILLVRLTSQSNKQVVKKIVIN